MNHDDRDLLVHTERAMAVVERLVPESLDGAPAALQECLNNAMLNVAVNRILNVEGAAVTAAMLWRLADALSSGVRPGPDQAIDLRELHS